MDDTRTPPAAPRNGAWIRPARRSDVPAILVINGSAAPGVTRLEHADLEDLFRFSSFFRVAELGGKLLAYLAAFSADVRYAGEEFLWFLSRYADFLYIDQVAVAPEHRRRGIASLLYREVEAFARAQGVPRLACEVNLRPPNPSSLAFHRARGYHEVGTLQVTDGRLVSLLVKELE
jgi:uncharacterized protein